MTDTAGAPCVAKASGEQSGPREDLKTDSGIRSAGIAASPSEKFVWRGAYRGNRFAYPPATRRGPGKASCLPRRAMFRVGFSRLPTRPSPAEGLQNIGRLFGTRHNFYRRRSCVILTSEVSIHAVSNLSVMLSKAKYLDSIGLLACRVPSLRSG